MLVYTFNAADQLLAVEQDSVTLGEYAYDGDGLRVKATAEGETVYYLSDGAGNTLAEYDGSGDLIAEYLYAGGRQLGKVEPDGLGGDAVSYFHPDHLGTAMLITDDLGAVTWCGEYEPFGEPVTSAGTPDRYRFTQYESDTETDLLYAKARYYHPRIGRFLSVDPVGGKVTSSQSWNRYSYAMNRPLLVVDPDGGAPAILPISPFQQGMLRTNARTRLEINRFFAKGGTAGELVGAAVDMALSGVMPETPQELSDSVSTSIAGLAAPLAMVAPEGAAARGAGGTMKKFLVRFGRGPEDAAALGQQAAQAEARGFPHGVSVMERSRISGTDRVHRIALRETVEEAFTVTQTGGNPAHNTVHLPKPVTRQVADLFNQIFHSGQ